jgi:hypothetical protein
MTHGISPGLTGPHIVTCLVQIILPNDHSTISAVSTTAWNSTLQPLLGPFRRDFLVLVMGQAVDAGAHDHRRRRDLVDPAGVVAGARDDVHVGIAQPLGGVADGLHAALVEGGRVELADDLGLENDTPISSQSFGARSSNSATIAFSLSRHGCAYRR